MAPKLTWLDRLPDAVAKLEAAKEPYVGRAGLERLLGIHRGRAIALLHRFGAQRIGRDLVVERTQLLRHLRSLRKGRGFADEEERRGRLVAALERARAAALKVPAPPPRVGLAQLPGVTVAPGEIVIACADPRDALQKLVALAQAMTEDLRSFERALASEPAASGDRDGIGERHPS